MNLFNIYKEIILEHSMDESDYSNYHEVYFEVKDAILYDIFYSIKNKNRFRLLRLKPTIYKRALTEFIRYGKFLRFPEKIIFDWKNLMVRNTAILESLTEIYGHTRNFPFDEFYDSFEIPEEERDYDFYEACKILDSYDIDKYVPGFSNGHTMISDYGLEPLLKLCAQLLQKETPEEIIVIINKMLDISHQRSDLAELYIQGGSASLDFITFDKNVTEQKKKITSLSEIFGTLFSNRSY